MREKYLEERDMEKVKNLIQKDNCFMKDNFLKIIIMVLERAMNSINKSKTNN